MPVMSSSAAAEENSASTAMAMDVDHQQHEASAVTIKHESMASVCTPGPGGGNHPGELLGHHHHHHHPAGSGDPHPPTLCGGCGFKITDRYYLVAVERAWHSECLRCGECRRPLDTALSCFARQSRIYCRDDYYRLFGVRRCNRCCLPLGSNELVMRARDAVFHLVCFTCAACNQPLTKGDIFGMRDGIVYCRLHYEMLHSPHHHHLHHATHPPPHHQLMTLGNNNLHDMPCDLSCTGPHPPHHGLLQHHHSPFHPSSGVDSSTGLLMSTSPASASNSTPQQHIISLLDPAESPLYPSSGGGLRPFEYMGASPSSGCPPSSGGFFGNSGPAVGGGQHGQKGRPRKRKMPAAAAAAVAVAALHSSNNHSGDPSVTSASSVGSPAGSMSHHHHLSASSLRLDLLGGGGGGGDLSSMEGMVYDSSGNGSGSGGGGDGGGSSSSQQQQQGGGQQGSQRTKRMRTSFKHHQLRTMKSYFAINQNPDAKDLKQLAQKTGLSKRVLQVWFQNARAKWRRNIMRHQDGGGGVGGAGGGGSTSSIKDGDLGLTASASTSSSSQLAEHHHQHQHLQHHQQMVVQQQQHRVHSASLGELTPPGSAGGMNTQHSTSAVSNEDASSNLVFSDLY